MIGTRFAFTLRGTTPLIVHNDSVEWADEMARWKDDVGKSAGKAQSRAGDDRTPAFRWLGCLYVGERHLVIPATSLIRCLVEAGKVFEDKTRKRGATLKRAAVTGVGIEQAELPILVRGKPIDCEPIMALRGEADFAVHQAAAAKHGFSLFVRRAAVNGSKHVRVRPKFDAWSIEGTAIVTHAQLAKPEEFRSLLNVCGQAVGLGDWRPSSPKIPGPYGRFEAVVKEVE